MLTSLGIKLLSSSIPENGTKIKRKVLSSFFSTELVTFGMESYKSKIVFHCQIKIMDKETKNYKHNFYSLL